MKELKEQDNEQDLFLSKIYLTPKKNKIQKRPFTTQALLYSQNSSKQYEGFDLSQSKPHQNIKQFKNQIKVISSYNSKSNSSNNSILPTVKLECSPIKNLHQMQIQQFTSNIGKKQQYQSAFSKFQKKKDSYREIIQKISKKENYKIQKPIFFQDKSLFLYSKLLTFNLNIKNSKLLVFDFKKRSLKAIYKCQYCKYQFQKAAALGGHISKCPKIGQKKQIDLKNLNKKRKSIVKSRTVVERRKNIILAQQKKLGRPQAKNILSDNSSQLIIISCSSRQKQNKSCSSGQKQNNQIRSIQSDSKENDSKGYNLRQKQKIKYSEM